MTSAMRRFARGCRQGRFPLTPREIVDRRRAAASGRQAITRRGRISLMARSAARCSPRPIPGRSAARWRAAAIWLGSYCWIPALGLLKPARGTARRDALMIAAHLVWGWDGGGDARARCAERSSPPADTWTP